MMANLLLIFFIYLTAFIVTLIIDVAGRTIRRLYSWFQIKFPTLLHWATAFFKIVLENRNLSLSSKIFGHCHLVPNFPPVPEMLSKIQSDPSPLGYSVFSNGLGKYAIWVYVEKYLNIAIWFRISPQFQRCYRKFNPALFHWPRAFLQMVLENTQFEFM